MSSNTTKRHVSELRVGMFVCKLDKDWLETPFLLQGFKIEEEDDIDVIPALRLAPLLLPVPIAMFLSMRYPLRKSVDGCLVLFARHAR